MKGIKQITLLLGMTFIPNLVSLFAEGTPAFSSGQARLIADTNWKEFHSVPGQCTLKFPTIPEHISEKMRVSDQGYDLK